MSNWRTPMTYDEAVMFLGPMWVVKLTPNPHWAACRAQGAWDANERDYYRAYKALQTAWS